MKNFIEVIDDIIPAYISDNIEQNIIYGNKVGFKYKPNLASLSTGFNFPGFVCLLENNILNEIKSTNILKYDLYQILYKLFFFKKLVNTEIFFSRIFLQVPTVFSSHSEIHTDLDFPHYVCLYYVNDSDGDTIFYDNSKTTEIKRVTPKKGRIAFFDGSIPHCSTSPSTQSRVVINTTFKGEKL